MKVYQPCYYNGLNYEDSHEIDSKYIYKNVEEAIKEIENYGIFDMKSEEYEYERYDSEPEMYEKLIFNVLKNKTSIYINGYEERFYFEPRYYHRGYAYIKVFELK